MPLRASKFTVTTTPQKIVDSTHAGATNVRTHTIWVDDGSLVDVWIGGDNVQSNGDNGFPVPPGGTFSIDVQAGDDLWAVVTLSTADVYVIGKRS